MSLAGGSSYGRTAVLIALGVLALTVGATAYIFLAHGHGPPAGLGTSSAPGSGRLAADQRRAISFLLMISISALLILMFVLGAYLVIRYGRFLARQRVGGQPTEYVDAWGRYRLTDEQISTATDEERPEGDEGPPNAGSPGQPPDEPPSGS
jgi:hypothetical protein